MTDDLIGSVPFEKRGKRRENIKTKKPDEEVRVEIESQIGTSNRPAYVRVYVGDKLVTTVVGTVGFQEGVDGGSYGCVELSEQ